MENQDPNQQIIRHQHLERPIEPFADDPVSHEKMSAHIQKHVGPISYVLHELVSDIITCGYPGSSSNPRKGIYHADHFRYE
jgi:hypothetical protein